MECIRRILHMHGIYTAVMNTDQKTAAVSIVLEQSGADKAIVAAELIDWCGFQFAVYDLADADSPEFQQVMQFGERFSVSPGV